MELLELVGVWVYWYRLLITLTKPFAGKTLLAKAVANQTSATFLRVCGSELIQKYLVRAEQYVHVWLFGMGKKAVKD